MTDLIWNNLIASIHASECRTVLALTGGGSGVIGQLLQIPGGSRTVLEAVVPYASSALTDWLGSATNQACSASTARAMAMVSWMRARDLSPETDPHQLIGVGVTASLVSDLPKKGEHRVHLAVHTSTVTSTFSLVLAKDQRARLDEEAIAQQLTLLGLAGACPTIDLSQELAFFERTLLTGEEIKVCRQQAESRWTNLLLGDRTHVGYPNSLHPRAIFPGAFNPPHTGHQQIVRFAATKLGCPIAYELSITNVDKPPLDFIELEARLKQLQRFDSRTPILLTDAPTFRAKAALFPGCTFVVGADTIARVGDPKYYNGEAAGFEAAIRQIAEQGCRFLIFGREIDGQFCVLSDLELPLALHELCDEILADEFREDVSSTSLRTKP